MPFHFTRSSLLFFLLLISSFCSACAPATSSTYSDEGSHLDQGIRYRDEQGDYSLAISEFSTAITANPQSATAYLNRAIAYQRSGQSASGLADFNQALTLDPQLVTAYVYRGELEQQDGQLAAALADYDHAIALNPAYGLAAAYLHRAKAYAISGRTTDALADYNQAVAIDPLYSNAYLERGLFYESQHQLDAAIADYTTAISQHPDTALAYIQRGKLYSQSQNDELALNDYRKAIDLLHPSVTALQASRPKAQHTKEQTEQLGAAYLQQSISLARLGQASPALAAANNALSYATPDSELLSTIQHQLHALEAR